MYPPELKKINMNKPKNLGYFPLNLEFAIEILSLKFEGKPLK